MYGVYSSINNNCNNVYSREQMTINKKGIDKRNGKVVKIPETIIEDKLEYYKDYMTTGDIILFTSHSGIISKLINFWTRSDYVHVGIVIKNVSQFLKNHKTSIDDELSDENSDGFDIGLLESGYESMEDMDQKTYKYGVQITPLIDKVKNYDGKVYWRRLNIENSPGLDANKISKKIYNIYEYARNKPYDINFIDLLELETDLNTHINSTNNCEQSDTEHTRSLLDNNNSDIPILTAVKNWFKHDNQKMDKFICSSLVAYIYTKLDFLDYTTHWTECIPSFFSEKNKNLELKQSVKLEREIQL